jgi:hypothetical protein
MTGGKRAAARIQSNIAGFRAEISQDANQL